MRTLIIGAGMADLTLAAKLSQQGRPPVVVERAETVNGGYALGLYPLGSCVLHGLGTYEQLVDQSIVLERYELASGSGRVLQAFDLSVLTGSVGPLLMVSRSDLLGILESSCPRADIRRGVTVSSLVQHDDEVTVTFQDGNDERYDLVVACDGTDSSTRDLVFGAAGGYNSGWLLWTWWADAKRFDPTVAREWCGAGCIFGAYPAPGQVMCAAGGPKELVRADECRFPAAPTVRSSDRARSGRRRGDRGPGRSLRVADARCPVVPVGRWACGPLRRRCRRLHAHGRCRSVKPMRAAAGLADELSKSDATTVPRALELYEKRCRRVIERSQTGSRRLARVMFVRDPRLARARDELARHYPASRALGEIFGSAHHPF